MTHSLDNGIEENPCGGRDNQRVDAKRRDAEAKQRSIDVAYILVYKNTYV
jgi:hypothetical protein